MAIISLGPWGGSGGSQWSYRASSGITEIVLRVEGNIKSISFRYASGLVSGTFGGEGNDLNDRGEKEKIEIQWPSEYLKSVSGAYGSYKGLVVITSLSFITNLNTYGPFGKASGDHFSIPIADSQVVGFHGRCGHYLDALGIFVKPANSHGSISIVPGGGQFSFRVVQEHSHETSINSLSFKDSNDPNDIGEETRIEINGNFARLTSITGTYIYIYGNYKGLEVITSLSFITNLTTYGPFGTAILSPYQLEVPSYVIGFHGRGGYYLDAIGIHGQDTKGAIPTSIGPPRAVPISIGPWGGQGGSPWSYVTKKGINQIVINVGNNIKAISFRDTAGLDIRTFGGNNPNDIGERKTVLINWPSEHLISISGTYGNFAYMITITSLSFTTNKATYGPFGTKSGTSFSIPISNNTVIGFHGRAGHYLDAIGIFVAPEMTI